MTDAKKEIAWRMYVMYFIVCLFAMAIVVKVFALQFGGGHEVAERIEENTTMMRTIEATRGNLYADDGSLLATSIPIYEVRMDVYTQALTDSIWDVHVDSLARAFSELYTDKPYDRWKRELVEARAEKKRYHLLRRKVRYTELQKIKQFPLLNRGQYKGGLIVVESTRRERPFGVLAARTIGYEREGVKPVGLEGSRGKDLKGVDGQRLMKRISGNFWMPVNDVNEVEPVDGADVITTIDINFQDVAETALGDMLKTHNADHGCVVLMEVETGRVKAIANLRRSSETDSSYYEYYNYAIGESTEPGSTFKLKSLMSLMDHGYVKPTDSVDTGNGKHDFYGVTMSDSKRGGYGKITVKEVFAKSSNIGVAKLVSKYYNENQRKFTDKLYNIGVNQPLGVEISGEGSPFVKVANAGQDWSGISLTQMAIGYEVQQTPMQVLAYYNAIANGGKLMKPQFVKEIRRNGEVIQSVDPEVINPAICSQQTVRWMQELCAEVVLSGTGKTHVKSKKVLIAGKTGTARIANDKYGYDYGEKTFSYQASFVGYFPADQPKYSCIVVVNAPKGGVYYGASLAGPVFKEIAEKVYAADLSIHGAMDVQNEVPLVNLPVSKHGNQSALQRVFAALDVPVNMKSPDASYVTTTTGDEEVELNGVDVSGDLPNTIGMGLMDAIYLLENRGKIVKVKGSGFVKSQKLDENNPDIVILELG